MGVLMYCNIMQLSGYLNVLFVTIIKYLKLNIIMIYIYNYCIIIHITVTIY